MQIVDHYGIHWEGPVAWLVQGRKGTNFVGLKAKCPFRTSGGMCNHLVPAAAPVPDRLHWSQWEKISQDPLVQAMLPIPRPGGQNLFFIEDPLDDLGLYIATLSRLSSPINSIVRPAWTMKMRTLEAELTASNIQPLTLVQANQKTHTTIDTLAKLSKYSPRTVIVTGDETAVAPPPFQRIKSEIRKFPLEDLTVLPLENIGAMLMRRYGRKEALDAPLETRDRRRQSPSNPTRIT